jgi:hypothetical protein
MDQMRLTATATHLVENLATGLYESVGQRVMELVRNGLVASMPDPKLWEPKRAHIDISLVPHHPLAPSNGPALIVLDHGAGMTDTGLLRYFSWLGTPLSDLRHTTGTYHGASQKGIGRLAALSLNAECLHDDYRVRVRNGYFLLSRTEPEGRIRHVSVIPEKVEQKGFDLTRFIPPLDSALGPLKGIRGSFTAIVIPNPIFSSDEDIYEAIKWLLPREQDKMFHLTIGGKPYGPPPLASEVTLTSSDGRYRARLATAAKGECDGIWLCDSTTGFRVASCMKLGRFLPEPLWYPDLVGDIFAPDLLSHQNTARSTLQRDFMRKENPDWTRLQMFLIGHVTVPAKKLVERDTITGEAAEALNEVVEMFNELYGSPDMDGKAPSPPSDVEHAPREHLSGRTSVPRNGGHTKSSTPTQREPSKRYLSVRVRDETFLLYRGQTLDPYIYAEVSPSNPYQIIVNVRGGYRALPENKQARKEHCLLQLLSAIGRSKFPMDPRAATCFANEVRAEFLRK